MKGPAEGAPALATWELLVSKFSFYVVPLVGALTLALGCMVFLGLPIDFARYLPLTLVIAGLATLLSSFSNFRTRETSGAGALRPSSAQTSVTAPPKPTPPHPSSHPRATREPSRSHPTSGLGRAAVSVVVHDADRLWQMWSTPKTGSLGAELVGPVPETAYSPPKPGAYAPFPQKDEDIVFLDSGDDRAAKGRLLSRSSRPSASSSPVGHSDFATDRSGAMAAQLTRTDFFTEADLDRLFPTETTSSVPELQSGEKTTLGVSGPDREPPRPVGPSSSAATDDSQLHDPAKTRGEIPVVGDRWVRAIPPSQKTAGAKPWGVGYQLGGTHGVRPILDSTENEVYIESINPIPPHLRKSPATNPPEPNRPGTGVIPRVGPGRVCSDCSESVLDFRSWSDCPECGDPICRDCLSSSFLRGAEGHCSGCRDLDGTSAA